MKRIVTLIFWSVVLLGCKDTTDDGLGNTNPNGETQDPITGVHLVFPHEDSLCNEGTNPTPTESTVYFEWEPNNNAESYTLTLENLNTGNATEYQTSDFIIPLTIQRAVAYRWFVVYDYQGNTKESATWNFYNAGPGVQTYAPFPAEIVSPTMAQSMPATSSVTLQWNGSDVDDDIIGYEVHFGSTDEPPVYASDISVNQLSVSVMSGTIYYWNVVTKDAAGNTSESGVYQFLVQ